MILYLLMLEVNVNKEGKWILVISLKGESCFYLIFL